MAIPSLKIRRESSSGSSTDVSLSESPHLEYFKTTCHHLSGDKPIDHYFPYVAHVASGAFGSVDQREVTDEGWALMVKGQPGAKRPEFVAVKEMKPSEEAHVPLEEAVREMVSEVAIFRQLTSRGLDVIPLYYGCLVGTTVYAVMEWVEGADLIDLLGETEQANILRLLKNVACKGVVALQRLHEAGVAHGDIRLENIRIQKDSGKLYLIDLGSACFHKDDPTCPSSFDRSQRMQYISPSLFLKGKDGTATFEDWVMGDWWAFGLVLYAILTGYHPYQKAGHRLGQDETSFVNFFISRMASQGLKDAHQLDKGLYGVLEQSLFAKEGRNFVELERFVMLPPALKNVESFKEKLKC